MTPQEAITLIKECGLNIEGVVYTECEKVVLNALEKQTPKKPIIHGFDPNALISSVSYTCPACSRHLGAYEYCPDCGQALDWSDSE